MSAPPASVTPLRPAPKTPPGRGHAWRRRLLATAAWGVICLASASVQPPAIAAPIDLPAPLQQHALPMWLIDPTDGTIVGANAAAQRLYGYPELAAGTLNITRINQLSEAEIRAEMERAKVEGRDFFLFPHRLASGEVVTVEVHSSPVVHEGRSLLLLVLLPESRSAVLQHELQRYQTRLEALVAERTAQVLSEQARHTRLWQASLAGALVALVALATAVVSLQRNVRHRRALTQELEDTLRGARLTRLRWDIARDRVTPCPRLRELLGLDDSVPTDIPTAWWQQRIHPQDLPAVQRTLRAHLRGETDAADQRYRMQHRDGHWIWLQAWGRVTARDARSGQALAMAGVVRDVSAEVALEHSRAIAASVFQDAGEAIVITDERGVVLDVNAAMERMSGYTREALIGRADLPWRPVDRQGHADWTRLRQRLLREGRWRGEACWRRHDGTEFPVIETIAAVRDEHGQPIRYVAIAQDISELKAQQRALEHQAYYDALTGLPNRILLGDRLDLAIATAHRHQRRVAVAYLDLDGFKYVNDTHGHDRGDWVLRLMAQRLQAALREGDTLARVGGDEFVAILCDLDDSDRWTRVVERLLAACAQPIEHGGETLRLSTSIGVTLYPDDSADAEVLLRHADQALYRAKREGKNRWCLYDPREDRSAAAHAELIADVRRALRSGGEFQLYVQPRVRLSDGAIVGAEALLRWQHPERGLLPPGAFLPAIEHDDVMVELGDWVIAEALRLLQSWHDRNAPWALSINVAARQLRAPEFAHRLEHLLARHPGLPPSRLELEIVESSALEGIETLEQQLQRCRALGVSLAIDDFGTGYSSLAYLKRLPANVVKIDQSFVRDVFDDISDLRIVEGVVALGQAFGLQVVAEGVETLAHGELLLRLGADTAQGYGVARPMPATAWDAWVAAWQTPPSWLRWRDIARSPWSRALARLEVEHRHVLIPLLQRERAAGPLEACALNTVMLEYLPATARAWPEYARLQQAHADFHDSAHRWWSQSPVEANDAELQRAHWALMEALHALLQRLIELPNGSQSETSGSVSTPAPPP
ncbi:sensor domain-containing protein [Tepidimonas charontis]|uniref:Cyclic di-GMP phosphodiesterase Gmr n=1 Tax=Tepidimonas charontis TaxID=2267262 RepID=A0A554XFN6_9BURK|nr:EAL domain-containing protein [Tepidimonas charontis]TSE34632.1 Cyclic di-GMP phosphodiesterase Gmr [Tepidimonas charontis]